MRSISKPCTHGFGPSDASALARWHLCGLVMALSSCCSWQLQRVPPIRDHNEVYVIVGVGDKPSCPVPPDQQVARNSQVGVEEGVWLRAVYADGLNRPNVGVQIDLDVVDVYGDAVSGASVWPAQVVSSSSGFAPVVVRFKARAIGVFRIRARYSDRHVSASSLSQNIVITR